MRNHLICLLIVSSLVFLVSRAASAALAEDIPACRCLENLSEAHEAPLDEQLRRDARWLVDRYCEEDIPLDVLSGGEKWLAEESCELLHATFFRETEGVVVENERAPLEVRLRTELVYRGRRLDNDSFIDWRHDAAFYAKIEWLIHPRRAVYLTHPEVPR